ncbi:MAG: pantoate--beta-alanine ligase [Acidobacteria bacterium]|jgi:pantoate--beta-alanine ligase|nr:pantoate--beta-alanine ligase [Acidobacteriota bacterium]MBA4124348.1 pantoate--beta-alanine ligase [Acidobacteriota bacterium]MBA4184549.1 pantoate--beta-alanine ligase [Acidobacteriota bacterium]
MEIINRRARMASLTRKLRRENKTVGFVPTMGALHEGHLRLVEEARQMCDIVIVSIFVNPAQFNDPKDLNKYPRDLTNDAALLTEYQVDYIFAPETQEIYGENFSTFVYVENLTENLEGASRPGHFRGVATVVTILFNTIRPDFAFFGQKDAQQVAVIKRLTQDLGFDTEIVVVKTVREESGLAMSSRNAHLSSDERQRASIIFQALRKAKLAAKEGERNAQRLAEIVREKIETESLAQIDYVAVVDNETLEPVEKIGVDAVLIAVAVRFGTTRLIDNTVITRTK